MPEKAKKRITATTSFHVPKSISTDLTIKSDSVFTNPIEKDGGVNLPGALFKAKLKK